MYLKNIIKHGFSWLDSVWSNHTGIANIMAVARKVKK